MSAIEVQALLYRVRPHFFSRARSVLHDVSFTVEKGEIFGFLGPNGAGKTTTIKILLNLLTPERGRVLLDGQPCHNPEARRRLGFLPERAYYPPHLSAYEFVLSHALLAGLPHRQARMRSWTTLEQVGLQADGKRRLGGFSKGMLQRTGLAQALVGDPDVVVLDEPMSGLDPLGRRDVRAIMQELSARKKTVFFSTHILPDVELICDRVGILAGGRLRRIGPLSTLMAQAGRGLEIDVESLDAAGRAKLIALCRAHRPHAHGDTFEVESVAAANAAIDCARAHNAQICGVHSGRSALETLFVDEAQTP